MAWITQWVPDMVEEKPLGCGGTILGLAIVGFLTFVYVTGGLESSDSKKSKTEQESTQTTKTQSTYTASDNSYSTSSSSNSASNSYSTASGSTGASNNKSTTSANSTDASYQTYLALVTLLENDGKSLKLCEAKKLTKGQELNLIEKMSELRGTTYYNTALKGIAKYCPKYASEYSKNGKYFASEADFYQSYINPDYSKILKAKKKEKQ